MELKQVAIKTFEGILRKSRSLNSMKNKGIKPSDRSITEFSEISVVVITSVIPFIFTVIVSKV